MRSRACDNCVECHYMYWPYFTHHEAHIACGRHELNQVRHRLFKINSQQCPPLATGTFQAFSVSSSAEQDFLDGHTQEGDVVLGEQVREPAG